MKRGFTLAEVLITLTIIGVIAVLTIPNLMQKWQDHADVVKVREAYSILSNALKMAVAENGPVNEWQEDQAIILSKYLRIDKICKGGNSAMESQRCSNSGWNNTTGVYSTKWPAGNWYMKKSLKGTISTGEALYSRIYLKNGMAVWFRGQYGTGYNLFVIDINGVQKPARKGYDLFYFAYDNEKLLGRIPNWYGDAKNCSTTNGYTDAFWDGFACSNWVLKHGNMDYKYRDVSSEW